MNIAVLLGISDYSGGASADLPASKHDAERMKVLLDATDQYAEILCITEDTESRKVKDRLRAFFRSKERADVHTAFFYFSGHG